MIKYVIKRFLLVIPVIFIVAIVIFTILYFTPGDPVQIMAVDASAEELEAIRHELGLDLGYFGQLANFLKDLFLEFDLGTSYVNKIKVGEEIMARFPRTFFLACVTILSEIFIAVPLGITAASHQGKWQDNLVMVLAMIGSSVPGFLVALVLMFIFSLKLGWFPVAGITQWKGWVVPVAATIITHIGGMARHSRSSMLEVIKSDYVTTARMKGLTERDVLYKHALPNALIPVVTNLGMHFGSAMGGTVVIETVFTIPGIGYFMVNAINNRDYPIIRGGVIFLSIMFCLIMMLVDILYAFIDPRIKAKYQESGKKRLKKNG